MKTQFWFKWYTCCSCTTQVFLFNHVTNFCVHVLILNILAHKKLATSHSRYSNLFHYFLSIYYSLCSNWKFQFFTIVYFFTNNISILHQKSSGAMCLSYINYCLISEVSIVTCMFNPLHSSMNQKPSASVIKVASIKNIENLHYAKEAIMCYQQIDA